MSFLAFTAILVASASANETCDSVLKVVGRETIERWSYDYRSSQYYDQLCEQGYETSSKGFAGSMVVPTEQGLIEGGLSGFRTKDRFEAFCSIRGGSDTDNKTLTEVLSIANPQAISAWKECNKQKNAPITLTYRRMGADKFVLTGRLVVLDGNTNQMTTFYDGFADCTMDGAELKDGTLKKVTQSSSFTVSCRRERMPDVGNDVGVSSGRYKSSTMAFAINGEFYSIALPESPAVVVRPHYLVDVICGGEKRVCGGQTGIDIERTFSTRNAEQWSGTHHLVGHGASYGQCTEPNLSAWMRPTMQSGQLSVAYQVTRYDGNGQAPPVWNTNEAATTAYLNAGLGAQGVEVAVTATPKTSMRLQCHVLNIRAETGN